MKKIIFIFVLISLSFGLTGCWKKEEARPEYLGVEETGNVIIAENGQDVIVTPGDVLNLTLEGEVDSGKQWSVSKPTSGNQIMLIEHKNTDLDNKEGKFKSEWSLKVEETGNFEVEFSYGEPGKEAEQTFSVNIVSQ